MPSGSLLCQNCHMSFSNPSLLYKHQARFCVGGPTEARQPRSPESEDSYVGSPPQTPEDRWQARSTELRRHHQPAHRPHPGHDGTPPPPPQPSSPVSTTSSMSIHFDEEQSPRRDYDHENRQRQLRMLVDSHGRNLADLQSKNKALAQQKTEIDRRLNTGGFGGAGLQAQISDQDARNRVAINALRQQVDDVKEGRPMAHDSTIIGEIIATREAYIRQGGNNAGLLATLSDLEAEARAIVAGRSKTKEKTKSKSKVDELTDQLMAFELENQRLQEELLKNQQDNNDRLRYSKNMQRDEEERNRVSSEELGNARRRKELQEREELMNRELQIRQKEYLQKLSELEHETEIAKQQARLERLRRDMAAQSPRPMPPQQPEAEMPVLMQPQMSPIDMDPLHPAPYDPSAGFMVFYDFLTGLDMGSQALRLVTGLYNNTAQYGEPTVLPTVYSEPNPTATQYAYYPMASNTATISARQPVPRCPPQRDLGLVIELQTTPVQAPQMVNPYYPQQQQAAAGRMATKAWTKVQLFDSSNRLISGRWRLPLRITPIKPHVPSNEIAGMPQQGMVELYIRLVNFRDADTQSLGQVNAQNAGLYSFPPQFSMAAGSPFHPPSVSGSVTVSHRASTYEIEPHVEPHKAQFIPPYVTGQYTPQNIPPPPDTPPPPSPSFSTPRRRPTAATDFYDTQTDTQTVGFQVDRVKYAEPGEAKVRLTAYKRNTGKVIQSSSTPVTCSTTAVRSNFKHQYHVYGQQEALFHGCELHQDILVIARFYLRRRAERGLPDLYDSQPRDNRALDDETLVAWAAVPLMITRNDIMRVNVGTHTLQLYEAPVPDMSLIPLEPHWQAKQWRRYNTKATLRIHILQGQARPGDLTDSEASDDEEENAPPQAWLPHRREIPPSSPYLSSDGFDLYIDSCRNLPDAITITRVAGRVMDRKYERVGKEVNTSVQLDTDVFNPKYDYRVEFREPNMPPSSTLVLKVYTIDKANKKLVVVGYATLNVFVETGTEKQPSTDSGGVQVSLNEGGHQLRLYHDGPNGLDPLTKDLLKESNVRYVPCATLLLRLVKAPKGPNGRSLEAEKVPQVDWERMGLWQPRPNYHQRVYFSTSCTPTKGENRLFHTLMGRDRMSVREAMQTLVKEPSEVKLTRTDKALESYIRSKLTKLMDSDPQNLDLNIIAQYNPKHGIKFSVDGALNLPWANFTHAHFCLNPPAAFYMGQPNMSYDKLMFTKRLDLRSTNKAPEWRDGFIHFPNRSYHRYLTMVIHLQEVAVNVSSDSYKYSLLEQAWTAVQVFRNGYAYTEAYQLPLFQGSPSLNTLQQLAHEPCRELLMKGLSNGSLKLLDNASLFVRLCDGRRDDELLVEITEEDSYLQLLGYQRRGKVLLDEVQPVVHLDKSYLPQQKADFSGKIEGKELQQLVPQGKVPTVFISNLASKFKSLVYKLYEEGRVTMK